MNYKYKISLDNEMFQKMLKDFGEAITHTLQMMNKHSVENAVITCKLQIGAEKATILDESQHDGTRDTVVPSFVHKVQTALQIKEEKAGAVGGSDYELVQDKTTGTFYMIPRQEMSGQLSLFMDDIKRDDAEEGEEP